MCRILSEAQWRQRIIKEVFQKKKTLSEIARIHHICRMSIYRWLKRYDGTLDSLKERSHRPKSHPNEHTIEEKRLIRRVHSHRKALGVVCLYMILKSEHGYQRSLSALCRVMRRLGLLNSPRRKKRRKSKPYHTPQTLGEKVQIDVKHVPIVCCAGKAGKLYQYTAIDECSRMRFRKIYDEHSSYNAGQFLEEVIAFFPFRIRCVQTDNGTEFTNALIGSEKLSVFEKCCRKHSIVHKRIRVATPRHNGKVERTHRTDQERFYNYRTFYSVEDANRQLKRYQFQDQRFPLGVLGWKSPREIVKEKLAEMSHIN